MAAGTRVSAPKPERMNKCWTIDFMSENLYNSYRFHVLNVLDCYSRDYVRFEIDTSINRSGMQRTVKNSLVQRMAEMITVNNGLEFIGKAIDANGASS